MATVDASIPLAASQVQWAPSPQQTISLMEFGEQMRQRRQQAATQNALRQILSNPDYIDHATGMPTADAIGHVMQIDPQTGMKLREQVATAAMHQSTTDKNRAQMAGADTERKLKLTGWVQDNVSSPALVAYEEAKKKGFSDEAAGEAAQHAYTDGIAHAKSSGLFTEGEADRIPPKFDYPQLKAGALKYKDYVAAQEKQKTDARADATAARAETVERERERHDRATEAHASRMEDKAERAASGEGKPLTDIGKLNADLKAGRITQQQFDDESKKKTGSKEGLTVADKMNPVMLATVNLDVKEGRKAIEFMEKAGLDKGSVFYADEHGAGAASRFAKKLFAGEKEQEFDVYANKLGQAIASAQSMGRGQISEAKIREAQKAIPVMGDSKHIREVKMGQLKAFFSYVDEVLKTPLKPGARTDADDVKDAADFSHLWK